MNEIETVSMVEEEDQLVEEYTNDLLPKKFTKSGKILTFTLIVICLAGLFAYIRQLRYGLGVTAMRDYVSWGIYISNFVFFVAISLVGSLITAIMYLLKVEWRAPFTRIAEMIAVASIIWAALIIVVDMGRPDRLYNVIIHGRIQSPIVWDIIVVITYMAISFLLLYFPMLPGLALCRDKLKDIPRWQQKMYRVLSLGWQGTQKEFKIIKSSIKILAVLIIPVALSIHTVTSWLFATTLRPGWDSTNFGPYFVAGAFIAGAAAVVLGMFIIYKFHPNYKKFVTDDHFDKMGKLLVLLSLVYLYFNVNEFLVPWYKMKKAEAGFLNELFTGHYAVMFWTVEIVGMVIPIILLLFKKFRRPWPISVISFVIVVGAWLKRYLIVIPTLLHPFLPMQDVPQSYKSYFPTWVEWTITCGSVAAALLIITLFTRYFPVISIWEVSSEKSARLEKNQFKLKSNKDEK